MYIYAIEIIKNPTFYICLLIENCVFIYFPYYNIHGIELFKKEMVKSAGFEPRIFQLCVRNLTASANCFQTHKTM